MATSNIKARTGNRIEVTFDGIRVGVAQSIRSSDDYALDPLSGIGDVHVQEYVPTMARHTVSLQRMVLYTDKLRSAGVSLANGDAALEGKIFDIVILDKKDGEVRKYTGCSFASGDLEVSAHKIISASCQFNALDVSGNLG